MSRVGQKPVQIPSGVEVKFEGRKVIVKGKKGTLNRNLPAEVTAKLENGAVVVTPINKAQRSRAMWGLSRAMIATMVEGVTNGYTIKLNIEGVGYRAAATGKNLQMNLGFSHPVDFAIPEGIEIKTPKPTEIEISGADKQVVGQTAAEIREWKKPEPYKGKGIAYALVYGEKGETIRRKEGKKK